jgi:hypothetical protein
VHAGHIRIRTMVRKRERNLGAQQLCKYSSINMFQMGVVTTTRLLTERQPHLSFFLPMPNTCRGPSPKVGEVSRVEKNLNCSIP